MTSSKDKDRADDKKSIVTSSGSRVTFQLERNTTHGSFYDVTTVDGETCVMSSEASKVAEVDDVTEISLEDEK